VDELGTRTASAIHEAGHATAAYVLRRGIVRISIRRHEGISGRLETTNIQPRQRDRRWRDVVVALAGPLAEKRYRPAGSAAGALDDARYVRDEVSNLVHEAGTPVSAEQSNRLIRSCGDLAERILDAHWVAVEALAIALLNETEVTGRAARAIVEGLVADSGTWTDEVKHIDRKSKSLVP
jgi:hypothetical protein